MAENEDTEFGRELISAMQEAAAIVRGEMDAARLHLPAGDVGLRTLRARTD